MRRGCDCGACCEQCGHAEDCIRWDVAVEWLDVYAQVMAEDGAR